METYICKRYEDLKDGEPILALGVHAVRWNFDLYGEPAYGFVPEPEDKSHDALVEALKALLDACERTDAIGELYELIDGELLDNCRAALALAEGETK